MEPGPAGKRTALIWISRDKHLVPEMQELCSSAGYEIIEEIGQGKREADPRYYLGPGKIEEVGELDVDNIVTVADLTPSQLFNISHKTSKKVSDRTRVILDLFQNRANSPEARMQVEIADLRYQLPVLREYIHQGKLSERPGFMAGGEYKIDYYFDMIKKRISQLKGKVEGERKRRGRKRALRRRRGAHLVSIAGYTNAGKSTLLNQIIETNREDKLTDVGGRMFTTISTTTRKMKGSRGCLVSDTVGFIRDLPPWLLEGFMSTLEEIFEADIVLLVLDASEDQELLKRKLKDSLSILLKGGTEGEIIIVPNKIDSMDNDIDELRELILDSVPDGFEGRIGPIVPISALEGLGIQDIIEIVNSTLPPLVEIEFEIPYENNIESLIIDLRQHVNDITEEFRDGEIHIKCSMEDRWAGHFKKKVESRGGEARILDP